MKSLRRICLIALIGGFCSFSLAVESGMYRLLSISSSEKLILVSQIPGKTKYILDVASTKVTVNGKPAEFKELKSFSIIQVKLQLGKSSKNGIAIDGSAIEINVSTPEPEK
jgi:hypothetical protein